MIAALALVPPADVIQSWNDLIIILQVWMLPFQKDIKNGLDDIFTYLQQTEGSRNKTDTKSCSNRVMECLSTDYRSLWTYG